jgi:hypothetical protein
MQLIVVDDYIMMLLLLRVNSQLIEKKIHNSKLIPHFLNPDYAVSIEEKINLNFEHFRFTCRGSGLFSLWVNLIHILCEL